MPEGTTEQRLRTGISRVRWCDPDNGAYTYKPAVMSEVMHSEHANSATEMCWLDELFHGGILLPEDGKRAVTLLITGPPGTGKSTLAMELCVRIAIRNDNRCISGNTLYVAYEALPEWMIDNARSFGWLAQAREQFARSDESFKDAEDKTVIDRLFCLPHSSSDGRISICTPKEVETGIGEFYNDLRGLLGITTGKGSKLVSSKGVRQFGTVVIDSLNTVEKQKADKFAKHYRQFIEAGPKLVIFILDSSPANPVAEPWEFAADIVLRLDRRYDSEYMIRTIEILKARYQAHVWGRHQLKIEVTPEVESTVQASATSKRSRLSQLVIERRMRAHPWAEGGIFIFPSIHYILSRYKRLSPAELSGSETQTVSTPIESLNELLGGGIPAGRTTALWGGRGTHKSHLGHMQVLHNVLHLQGSSIIVSLRDDEATTKEALRGIIEQHFLREIGNLEKKKPSGKNSRVHKKLDSLLLSGQLEILYYPPGYVTPEEFFHRLLLSIYRMRAASGVARSAATHDDIKQGKFGITLLFNSLDQIASRFPLCAKEGVFISGIIQTLASIGVTSMFVGAESSNDKGLLDLLSMAELILRVERRPAPKKEQLLKILSRALGTQPSQFKKEITETDLSTSINAFDEDLTTTVLTVERYAGGNPAGSQGMLELVVNETETNSRGGFQAIMNPGLQFVRF